MNRLLLFDLDGTLLRPDKTISPVNIFTELLHSICISINCHYSTIVSKECYKKVL